MTLNKKKRYNECKKGLKNVEKMIVGLKTILISIKTKSCFRKQKKSPRFVFAKYVFEVCSSHYVLYMWGASNK